ncbi:MAG: DNA polymerase III subunit delta [Cystobacterineae bacterium]|nr:DNA polymerase III subunit delta [Cystobacterineae bacterium]
MSAARPSAKPAGAASGISFFYGEEFLVEQAAKAWGAAAGVQAEFLTLSRATEAELEAELRTLSLFGEKKYVWAKEVQWAKEGAPKAEKKKKASSKSAGVAVPGNALLRLFQQGLPEGNYVLLTQAELDIPPAMEKWLKAHATLQQYAVAAKLKDLDVDALVQRCLEPLGKTLSVEAKALLKMRLGSNLRLWGQELEKLAGFAEKKRIEVGDVELLVANAREEEFLELSEALQQKNYERALSHVSEALSQGASPLMLVASIASVVRGLLLNMERLHGVVAGGAFPKSYGEFQRRVWPKLEERSGQGKMPHPYAVFMGMSAASRFSLDALKRLLVLCAQADVDCKSGKSAFVVEKLVGHMCLKAFGHVFP